MGGVRTIYYKAERDMHAAPAVSACIQVTGSTVARYGLTDRSTRATKLSDSVQGSVVGAYLISAT